MIRCVRTRVTNIPDMCVINPELYIYECDGLNNTDTLVSLENLNTTNYTAISHNREMTETF